MNEEQIFTLILNAGDARTLALKAIRAARKEDFKEAEKLIKESGQKLSIAHKTQMNLIQNEINGVDSHISLLVIHAQDHLMNAITIKELAQEIVWMKEGITDEDGNVH